MKIIKYLGMALCAFLLSSCSSDDVLDQNESNTPKEFVTVSLNLGGEFSVSEVPLRAATANKTIYGINVYYQETEGGPWNSYGYGLFDKIENMKISLISSYKYKFVCTLVKENVDKLYFKTGSQNSLLYYQPFQRHSSDCCLLENKFIVSMVELDPFLNLASQVKVIDRTTNSTLAHAAVDRFYGELEGYTPMNNGNAEINLKRTSFGLNFKIEPPVDGNVSISSIYAISVPLLVSSSDAALNYESIHSFAKIIDCWKNDKHSETVPFTLTWTRKDGSKQTFEKTIIAKRNVRTIISVNTNKATSNSSIKLNIESTPMTDENDVWEPGSSDAEIVPGK